MEASASVVVADFEAGLGTLSRLEAESLDALLVVTEPTAKALEIARRALEMVRERRVAGRVIVVANRVRDAEDRQLTGETFPDGSVTVVPDDPALRAADARGVAPFDAAPDAPAVRALRALAESLVP
jgi:CO dehydrogenase maturation factor